MTDLNKGSVLMLHAAIVDRNSLVLLAKRLEKRGFRVFRPNYPNRKLTVQGCAESLVPYLKEISRAPGPFHLLGHSMGGLVARKLLTLYSPPKLGRLITLGTPHLGSPLADKFRRLLLYQWLFGPAGQDLISSLPIDWLGPWPPPYEIGLIAGTIPFGFGSLQLPYPHDGVVSQFSSQPEGAKAYATVSTIHELIPMPVKTARFCANFFQTGSFTN